MGTDLLYPAEFPVQALTRITAIVMSKQTKERKSELVKSCWVVVGYALGAAFSDPDRAVPIGFDEFVHMVNVVEAFEALEGKPMEAIGAKSWQTLMLELAMLIITKLLEFLQEQ